MPFGICSSWKIGTFRIQFEKEYSLSALLAEGSAVLTSARYIKKVQVMKEEDNVHKEVLGAMESRMKPLVETQAEIDFIRKWGIWCIIKKE